MARAFLTAQTAYLAGPLLAFCNCIRIVRLDSRVFTYTSLDRDLTIAGEVYEAFTSVDVSELASQIGSGVDNTQFIGLLSSADITETDLLAGLWDGAKIEFFFYAFENASTVGKLGPLVTGTIGEISEDGGQFTAEVRGLTQRLSQQIVELLSPVCRVRQLFDRRCMPKGFNEGTNDATITPAGCRNTRTVSVVNSTKQVTFSGDAGASTLYRHGLVTWLTGLNAGLAKEIKEHVQGGGSTAVVTLQEPMPFLVTVGDTAILEWGCDRTLAQCQSRFSNSDNYQGEPGIPGSDAMLRVGRRH